MHYTGRLTSTFVFTHIHEKTVGNKVPVPAKRTRETGRRKERGRVKRKRNYLTSAPRIYGGRGRKMIAYINVNV